MKPEGERGSEWRERETEGEREAPSAAPWRKQHTLTTIWRMSTKASPFSIYLNGRKCIGKNQLRFSSSIAAKLARWAFFCISFSAKNKTLITFLTASLAAPLWVILRYVSKKRQRREQQHLLPSLATCISCRSFANGSQLGSERLLWKCSSVICSEDVPLWSRAAFEAHNEVLIKELCWGKFWIILTPLESDPLPDCALLLLVLLPRFMSPPGEGWYTEWIPSRLLW